MKTKTNKVPLVGPKGRRELLDRIEDLEERVKKLEQGSSADDEEVVSILVGEGANATKCYISPTDAIAFGNMTTGISVYADESLSTPATNGVYDYDETELFAYGEDKENFAYPDITGFTVFDGVIRLWANAEPEE